MTVMAACPHEYEPSRVGHGEAQCKWCLGTNRENAIIAPNHCIEREAKDTALRTPSQESPDTTEAVARACDHAWRYTGTDCRGSHKGEDHYLCTKCSAWKYELDGHVTSLVEPPFARTLSAPTLEAPVTDGLVEEPVVIIHAARCGMHGDCPTCQSAKVMNDNMLDELRHEVTRLEAEKAALVEALNVILQSPINAGEMQKVAGRALATLRSSGT